MVQISGMIVSRKFFKQCLLVKVMPVGSVIGGNGAIVFNAGRDVTATAATDTTSLVEDHYHVGSTGGGGNDVVFGISEVSA